MCSSHKTKGRSQALFGFLGGDEAGKAYILLCCGTKDSGGALMSVLICFFLRIGRVTSYILV